MRNLSRRRAAAVVAVVSCLLAGAAATTWLTMRGSHRLTVTGNPSVAAPDEAVRTVPVVPDRETTIAVNGQWSVTVPAGGAGPGEATLTVSPVAGLTSAGRAQHPLAGAELALSTGQPAKPFTFTYRLDQPLPADQVLYLLDDDADGAPLRGDLPIDRVDAARVHPATLSPDRRLATVSVAHLSFKEWVSATAGDLTQALGQVFGQRAGAPECTGARPAWARDVTFVDDANAPLRVCTGVDPQHPDVAVVKVVNNRGGALLITAPARPTWVYQSVLGDHVGDWMTNVMIAVAGKLGIAPAVADRTWLVPPGQQIHLGFTQAALNAAPDPAVFSAVFTPETTAIGLINSQVSEALADASPAWSYAVLAVCAHDAASAPADAAPSATSVIATAAQLANCAVENVGEVVKQIRNAMPAEEWEQLSPQIFRTANAAKKALGPVIVAAQISYIATDVGTTLFVELAALKVNLFHDGLDSPMLTDKDGHPVPNPAADRIRRVYGALKAGNTTVLRRAYAPTGGDAPPWDQVAPLVVDTAARSALLEALRTAPGIGEDTRYNYSLAGYGIGFATNGALDYLTSATSVAAPSSDDPYGCLAADRAMDAGQISYAQHPCASHFQDQSDPTRMDPDTPATRWALCHEPPTDSDPPYLVGGRVRYCH